MKDRPISIPIVFFAALAATWAGTSWAAANPSLVPSARTAIREQFRELAGIPGAEVFVGEVRLTEPAGLLGPVEVVRIAADGAVRSGRGIPVSIYVRDAAGETREVRGSADVSVQAPVVVSARNVPAGAIVSREDVAVRMRDYTSGSDGVLHTLEEALGKRARWQLTGGVAIRKEYVEDPAALRRGDAVTIVAESGPVRITGKGISLQAAGVGDTVLVKNTASGKEMAGRLHEGRVVRVD
jgi:flagella basal body P-ring formation protein FlgA